MQGLDGEIRLVGDHGGLHAHPLQCVQNGLRLGVEGGGVQRVIRVMGFEGVQNAGDQVLRRACRNGPTD